MDGIKLFIRSQNRDVLVNVNDICFNKLNIHSEIIYQFRCYGYGDDYYILGEYSTKEKALKVLNEIQEVIEDNQFTINNTGIRNYVLYNRVQVYEMPQDEDV